MYPDNKLVSEAFGITDPNAMTNLERIWAQLSPERKREIEARVVHGELPNWPEWDGF